MKMLVNLLKPNMGEIELFGQKLTKNSYEVLKRIGSVIEYPVFYDHLSGKENLRLHGEYMGYYDSGAIVEALKMVNLTNIDGKKVKEYSLGMKQRLGIARAIMTKPELLILDEPINGLDPLGIKEIRNLLKSLSVDHGITILLSSHIIAEIEQIADTIGVIDHGCLIDEISLEDTRLERSEYISVIVDHIQKATFILDNELSIKNFKVVEQKEIRIYDMSVVSNQVSRALILGGVNVDFIGKKEGTLEDYFLSLIKDGDLSA
jgi:ABC-2 type transport system ATP-binding protein